MSHVSKKLIKPQRYIFHHFQLSFIFDTMMIRRKFYLLSTVLMLFLPQFGVDSLETRADTLTKREAVCDEIKANAKYGGEICTFSNLTARRINYDFSRIQQRRLYFKGGVIPYIPPSLKGLMESVEVLNMTRVSLRSIEESNLRGASKLYTIILTENKLTSIGAGTFADLAFLDTVDLSHNRLADLDRTAFTGSRAITVIDLSHNYLEEIRVDFNELPYLRILDLSHNHLTRVSSDSFKFLKHLLDLNLVENHIKRLDLQLCNEHALVLDVSNNSLEDITLDWNPVCQDALDHSLGLILSNNAVHSLNSDRKIRMTRLDVSYNGLTSIRELAGFNSLEKLNISHNAVKEVDFKVLKPIEYLKELDLSYNSLTGLNVDGVLKSLPNLAYLAVKNNSWDCDVGDNISRALDLLDIETDIDVGDGTCKVDLSVVPLRPEVPESDSEYYDEVSVADEVPKPIEDSSSEENSTPMIIQQEENNSTQKIPIDIDIDYDDEYYEDDNTSKPAAPSNNSSIEILEPVKESNESNEPQEPIPDQESNPSIIIPAVEEGGTTQLSTETQSNSTQPTPTVAPPSNYSTMLFTKPTRPTPSPGDAIEEDGGGSMFAKGNKRLHELVDDALVAAGLPVIFIMFFTIIILAGIICKLSCSLQKKDQISISSI